MSKILGVHTGGTVGNVLTYTASTVPAYTLICNGAAVSRTQYPDLFNAIGITHGQGDGSTTFNLPDHRGRFLRGTNSGSGNDPDAASRIAPTTGGAAGDNVGSVQADGIVGHTHQTYGYASNVDAGNPYPMSGYLPGAASRRANAGAAIDATGGNETRPKNANVVYCIVWR